MAKYTIELSTLTAIADKIREHVPYVDESEGIENMSPLEMPEMVQRVYGKGSSDGFGNGYRARGEEYEGILQMLSESLSEALTSGGSNEKHISANIEQAKSDIGAIKDLLVDWGEEVPVGTPSADYPEMLQTHYDNVIEILVEKVETTFDDGVSYGKAQQYDEFWGSYQNYGNRAFASLFSSPAWDDTTFKPKHSMRYAAGANAMFANAKITDLQAILDRQGVTFDFSACYSFANLLQDSTITHVGVISTVSSGAVTNIFNRALKLETVDLLVLKSDGAQTFSGSFGNCTSLKNIVISGVIGQNFDISYSPLTKNSITSVVEHLSDTAAGKTLTLKKSAVNAAFGINVDDETTYPADSEFYVLRHSKDNWTFSYV